MRKRSSLSVMAMLSGLLLLPAGPAAAEHDEERVAVFESTSGNPVDIAVANSLAVYPEEYPVDVDAVLVARDDGFADALASGSLQGALQAPLLLTPTATLAQATADEIQRLAPDRVFILGGTGAVSAEVEARLRELVSNVTRISGSSRIETAAAIARQAQALGEIAVTHAIVVRAFGDGSAAYADALAAGAWSAAMLGAPVLLTETDQLSAPTEAFLRDSGMESAAVVGGRAAVSDQVLAAIQGIVPDATRVSGPDRFATALAVARAWIGDGSTIADSIGAYLLDAGSPLAWSEGFTGAILSASSSSPILLTDSATLPAPTREWLGGKPIPEDDFLGFRLLFCTFSVPSDTCHAAANIIDGAFGPDAA